MTSLRRRLGVGLAIGVTAMWAVATLVSGFVVQHELDEAFDSALQETAQRLLPLAVADIANRDDPSSERRAEALAPHDEFLTYLVRDSSGRTLLRSHDADPGDFPAAPLSGFGRTDTHRIYGEAAVSGTITLEVAEPFAHRREATVEAMSSLVLPLPILIPASLVGVWWLVGRSLRPVRAFRHEIERRGASDLSPIAKEGLPDEFGTIADAVNRLIRRLQRTLEAERSFAANSAHELRTPIAAMLAQTQRLIAETPPGAGQDRAHQIESSLHRLAHLSEKLMQLAKAEGGGLWSETAQDLVPILRHLVDEFSRGTGAGDRLSLAMPAPATLESRIDPDAFAILLRNLIENALKHGAAGEPVEVRVSDTGCVRIVNRGPILGPETLARLRRRFERGSGSDGSGLGLAIAETIANATGCRLDLRSPATGHADGFEAILHLPTSPPPSAEEPAA